MYNEVVNGFPKLSKILSTDYYCLREIMIRTRRVIIVLVAKLINPGKIHAIVLGFLVIL